MAGVALGTDPILAISAMLRAAHVRPRPAAPRRAPPSRSRGPRHRDGRDPSQEPRLTFDTLGLSADLLKTVAEEGYTAPTPVQEAAIPLVLARTRRPRRRPDRHRQDRRLHAAHPRPAAAPRQHLVLAGPPPGPRPDPRAHARARDAGRRERPDVRPDRAAALDRRLRRHPHGSADQGPARRGRDPRRDARAACSTSSARRSPTWARSRSSSSTRPTGCSTWASCRISSGSSSCCRSAPEPDVLGHVLGRHPTPVGDDPARPGDGRGRAAQHHGRGHPPARLPGRSRPQGSAAGPPHPQRATCTRCWSSRGRSWPPRDWPRGWTARASMPSPSTATARSPSGRARSRASRPATSGSSSRPTSRRAASTSRTCRSSSTSSCRGTRRTTSTASAGPAGPAPTGEAISLVCIDEVDLLRGIQRMLKQAIPWTVEDGFVPDRNAEPRPLGMRGGHARVTGEHHAHRKPVRRRTGAGSASAGRADARWSGGLRRVGAAVVPSGTPSRAGAREVEAQHDVGSTSAPRRSGSRARTWLDGSRP